MRSYTTRQVHSQDLSLELSHEVALAEEDICYREWDFSTGSPETERDVAFGWCDYFERDFGILRDNLRVPEVWRYRGDGRGSCTARTRGRRDPPAQKINTLIVVYVACEMEWVV